MLALPENSSSIITVFGIDPGSNTLGTAMIQFDVRTMSIALTQAKTYVGEKMALDEWIGMTYGNRAARIQAHEQNLGYLFRHYQPNFICCESPFYNPTRPGAYGALVETMDGIRRAIMQYDIWLPMYTIDPSTIKNAVGAKGNCKKDVMLEKIIGLGQLLNYSGSTPLHELDEHAIDAIAVAYAFLQQLIISFN